MLRLWYICCTFVLLMLYSLVEMLYWNSRMKLFSLFVYPSIVCPIQVGTRTALLAFEVLVITHQSQKVVVQLQAPQKPAIKFQMPTWNDSTMHFAGCKFSKFCIRNCWQYVIKNCKYFLLFFHRNFYVIAQYALYILYKFNFFFFLCWLCYMYMFCDFIKEFDFCYCRHLFDNKGV